MDSVKQDFSSRFAGLGVSFGSIRTPNNQIAWETTNTGWSASSIILKQIKTIPPHLTEGLQALDKNEANWASQSHW